MRLRVLSYNIHKGFSSANRNFVLKDIRDSVRSVDADVVCLQEVLGHHQSPKSRIDGWPTQAQFEFLADEVWHHHAYGKNAVYASGHHGNAILSKHPISRWENIDVSTNRLERRGILHAVLEPTRGKEVHVISLHLGLFETGRKQQIRSLAKQISSVVPPGVPLVVAGDFNDWNEKASSVLDRDLGLKEAFLHLHREHARTFPIWLPALRLDRIYLRNLKPVSATALVGSPWNRLSDHAPVLAEAVVAT